MKVFLEECFAFTRSERQGAITLIFICVIIMLFPYALPFLFPKSSTDFSVFQANIDAFTEEAAIEKPNTNSALFAFDPNTIDKARLMQLGLSDKVANTFINYRNKVGDFRQVEDLKKVYGLKEELYQQLRPFVKFTPKPIASNITPKIVDQKEIVLFPFDPNTASEAELNELGLSAKVVKNIINYRTAGGSYKQKEDLQKLYSLSDKEYQRIEAYIAIEVAEKTPDSSPAIAMNDEFVSKGIPDSYNKVSKAQIILDINTASVEEWQQLSGIGLTYANRIVKFRAALGGFSSVQQVAETYNLPDSTFQKIQLSLRPSSIPKKLKINELEATSLKAHPYLKWKTANMIVNYRTQHGPFSSLEDLRKIKGLSEADLERLAPYLEF